MMAVKELYDMESAAIYSVRISALISRIKDNEYQDAGHNDHIAEDYYESFQVLGSFLSLFL